MSVRVRSANRQVPLLPRRSLRNSHKLLLTLPLVLAAGCRDATQVHVELRTDALCGDVRETSITVSSAAELESSSPNTTTDHCATQTGRIGSLTLVPTEDDSSAFSVRAVVGLGKSAEACVADNYQGGCIVARRSLRFIPHRTLYVPIKLEVICRDIPCGATQTCKSGACVDSTIGDVNSCTNPNGCDLGFGGAGAGGTTGNPSFGGASQGGLAPTGGTFFTGGLAATGGASSLGGAATAGIPGTGGAAGAGSSALSSGATGLGGSTLAGGGAGFPEQGGSTSSSGVAGAAGQSMSNLAGAAGASTRCGDGVLNPYAGEFCDDGSNSTRCNADCWPARCGDGFVNTAAGEECDGTTTLGPCTPTCHLSVCGDGFVDASGGEECEVGLGGCSNCKQDRANQLGGLTVESVRGAPFAESLSVDVVVSNVGTAVPANELTWRYYYTADNADPQQIQCDWADIGCANTLVSTSPMKVPCSVASHYAEVGFSTASNLSSFAVIEFQGRIYGSTGAAYDFTNDYSHPMNSSGFLPTLRITLYRQGKLIWGNPPCGCGNGTLDTGESCDHAGESAFCNADCTVAVCGDAKINATAGETCDEGRPSLTCSPECKATGLPSSAKDALLLWLDATQPNSLSKGLNISAVADRSGNANHVIQSTTSRQPLWFPDVFGRNPAFFFDGSTHEMAAATAVNDVGRGSIFVVHRVEPVGLTATLIANGWASSGGGFAVRTRPQLDGLGLALGASSGYSAVEWALGARSGNGSPTPGVTYWSWAPPQFSWARGADSELLSTPSTYAASTDVLRLGGISASEPYRGWIGEVMIFSRDLATGERDAILNHLRGKWGLQ